MLDMQCPNGRSKLIPDLERKISHIVQKYSHKTCAVNNTKNAKTFASAKKAIKNFVLTLPI